MAYEAESYKVLKTSHPLMRKDRFQTLKTRRKRGVL